MFARETALGISGIYRLDGIEAWSRGFVAVTYGRCYIIYCIYGSEAMNQGDTYGLNDLLVSLVLLTSLAMITF